MSSESTRSPELLHRGSSRLLIVDVQEKLAATLPEATRERLLKSCRFLGDGAKLLGVPTFITEQYPQGLGPTVPELAGFSSDRPAKKKFSCVECLAWPSAAEDETNRFQIVVAGMEAHVCVQQTVLDLLAKGYQVYVVADSVASRRELDQQIGLERMAGTGAVLGPAKSNATCVGSNGAVARTAIT